MKPDYFGFQTASKVLWVGFSVLGADDETKELSKFLAGSGVSQRQNGV
jgi:hypothetical protein